MAAAEQQEVEEPSSFVVDHEADVSRPRCEERRAPCRGASHGVDTLRRAGAEAGCDSRDEAKDFVQAEVSACNFRAKYINKLAGGARPASVQTRSPAYHTVTIFDWDDTLLCTTWLKEKAAESWFPRFWLPDSATEKHLASIELIAIELLSQAERAGPTFIVTNASRGWVKHSARRWIPGLLPFLQKVQIISARDCHRRDFPTQVGRWKVEAFLGVQRGLPDKLVTNLVVMGDSEFEMTAAQVMRGQFEYGLVKAVKFFPNPSPGELLAQMQTASKDFEMTVTRIDDVRIDLHMRC